MFDFSPEGPCYYLRFEVAHDYLNLLFIPETGVGTADTNQSLMYLFRQYADPAGVIAYYDPKVCCIITLRARDLKELRVYLYDDEAPYDGMYLDGQFIEALEAV